MIEIDEVYRREVVPLYEVQADALRVYLELRCRRAGLSMTTTNIKTPIDHL